MPKSETKHDNTSLLEIVVIHFQNALETIAKDHQVTEDASDVSLPLPQWEATSIAKSNATLLAS